MTAALKMSQIHGGTPTRVGSYNSNAVWADTDTKDYADSLDNIMLIPSITDKYSIFCPLKSICFVYEPTLQLTIPGVYNVRSNDNSSVIFGFKQINRIISSLISNKFRK